MVGHASSGSLPSMILFLALSAPVTQVSFYSSCTPHCLLRAFASAVPSACNVLLTPSLCSVLWPPRLKVNHPPSSSSMLTTPDLPYCTFSLIIFHLSNTPHNWLRLLLIVPLMNGEGDGNPLQYSCLENPMDGGAWWAAVHGVAKSRTWLSDFLSLFTFMHWRRKWQPTPVFLPGESQGWESLVGCHLWGHTESDTTEAT